MTEPGNSTDRDQTAPPSIAETDGSDEQTGRKPPIGETVGTGTSIALGCVAGTVVLIVIGLIFLLIVMVFA